MKKYSFLEERSLSFSKLFGGKQSVNRKMMKDAIADLPKLGNKKNFVRIMKGGIEAGHWDKIQKKPGLMSMVKGTAKMPFKVSMDWNKALA